MRARDLLLAMVALGSAAPAAADTLFVEGRMTARVTVELLERYEPEPGTRWLAVRSYRTPSFDSATWRQQVLSDDVSYSLAPRRAETRRGDNVELEERWEQPAAAIQIVRRIVVHTDVALTPVDSRAPFPLAPLPAAARPYLDATPLTRHDDPAIRDLARRLVTGARTQRDAVSRVLEHVVDTLSYQYDAPAHDAVTTLERRRANCQGYAHLSLALLRAAGIPARAAVGLTLSKAWQAPSADGMVTFRAGKGRHAWIEVYYPDLGWVPYDPQSSHLFVSLYHVRQAVGRDVGEAVGVVRASPALPGMSETVDGSGVDERFSVRTTSQVRGPRNFVVSVALRDAPVTIVTPAPMPLPAPAPSRPADRRTLTKHVEFGNTEFPAALRIVPRTPRGAAVAEAPHAFIVETAEYATGADELAQAFVADEPVLLVDVALALQKFGGRHGEVWIDVLDDRARKPGAIVAQSRRVPVAALVDRGGYRWVAFRFGPDEQAPVLPPGRYWAVLRSTGDGIFNWYFSPANAYGDPDDSRSRPRGAATWPNLLNYRFNFRITGLVAP